MAPFGEQLPRHQSETFRRTGDEDASHMDFSSVFLRGEIIQLRIPGPEH
jgi:hypothetical protein